MYNIDFLPQLEKFGRHLFGKMPVIPALPAQDARSLADGPLRGHGQYEGARYMPPPDMKMVDCHEDANGEWVPSAPVGSKD